MRSLTSSWIVFAKPVLMFVALADTTVPPAPSIQFARSRPDLVTLLYHHRVQPHRLLDRRPAAYESAVTAFLNRTSWPTPAGNEASWRPVPGDRYRIWWGSA